MSSTATQIRAHKKYRGKQEYLQTHVSPVEKLAIAEHVNGANETLSDFIRCAIAETMESDKRYKKSLKQHKYYAIQSNDWMAFTCS